MRTKHIFLLVPILLSSNAYTRDLTTCTASDGTTGYLVETPRVMEENAETVCWSCQEIADYGGVECSRFFNVSIWTGAGTVYCDGTYQYTSTPEKNCYISIPAGYDLDTDYVFDEDRYNESIYECSAGSYCPGAPYGYINYTDLMSEYMGSTGAFGQSCPYAPNTYTTSALKNLVQMTSEPGAGYIYDCFVPAGTYYDSTGSFEITSNSCYYTDD
ncbi:MAG: hypothetical protein IJX89_03915 [Alphaproteobacteria bacterium]|nr:hypothetical protein [Alphaproteobacteria bacterium]